MSWSREILIDILKSALSENSELVNIEFMVHDDNEFDSLCASDNFCIFISQYLDCLYDSQDNPQAYSYVTCWKELGNSLLEDIKMDRVPSHPVWNEIYTLRCRLCHKQTRLSEGRFYCSECKTETTFIKP